MQKLVIKEPFMGVQPCEIEFDRFLLLIGEQASGKSTIAKLIYFFQSVPDVIYKNVTVGYFSEEKKIDSVVLNFMLIREFLHIFQEGVNNYSIEFHYNPNVILKINGEWNSSFQMLGRKAEFYNELDSSNHEQLLGEINDYKEKTDDKDDIKSKKQLYRKINTFFERKTSDNNFLIAGRNNIVAYAEYFEEKIKSDIERLIDADIKGQDFEIKTRTGNEKLLLEFVTWSSNIRKYFQNNGGSFKSVKPDLENQSALSIFETIFSKILKAEYSHNSNGEFLKINDNESVYMKDASSGQQEVLRILQGLYLSVGLKNRREFFVVKEPEAHLYPLAQKELINAFSLFLNTIKEGRLIITTHSPYILACVNILLFANYVANEIPESENEVLASVPKDFWLDSKLFNAYSLGHEGEYCKNIKDTETGLIDQNYLDLISEQLGLQYNNLYHLLVESHV